MPEKPIPENDPVVSKSFAPHYVISMVLLMATLFWALWDEDFGQRPWKTFQHEWKSRYSTFLKNARTQSGDSQKEVETSPDYPIRRSSKPLKAPARRPRRASRKSTKSCTT